MKNNRFLVFILFVVALSLMGYSKFTDLGGDPSMVKVKRVITVQYKLKEGDFLYDKFKGWTMDGKYIMIVEEDEGKTLLYDKEGKYFKKLEGKYLFMSYSGERFFTEDNSEYRVYDTKTWKLIKKFKIKEKRKIKPFAFYKELNKVLSLETKYVNNNKYELKIIKYDYINGGKEIVCEINSCNRIYNLIYIPDYKLYYSKYYCKGSIKRGTSEYLLDLKTCKIKNIWDRGISEVFRLKDRYVFEDNIGRIIDLKDLKTIKYVKLLLKPELNQNLKKHYGYVDLWDGRIFPNAKLYLQNIGTFNDTEGGDYPLDSYIFVCDLDMKKRRMLKLKSPTTLPEILNFFSPEGDRFVAMRDYKKFVIIVLERRGGRVMNAEL